MPPVPPLVDPAWLAARLGDPGVLVADCRWALGDPGGGRRAYEAGHVPGAVFLDVETELSAPPAAPGPRGPVGGRHPLPAREALRAALRRAGVRREHHVVAYDDGTGGAARLWWLLRHHGHARVSVLRGGYAAWPGPRERGGGARPPGDVELAPAGDGAIGAEEVDPARQLLLDARAGERFRGEREAIDPVAGHIPGARNLPAAEALPPPESVLADPRPAVAYCGSGVSACVVLLALADAGREDAKLYPGSWSDWVARGLPVETGRGERA